MGGIQFYIHTHVNKKDRDHSIIFPSTSLLPPSNRLIFIATVTAPLKSYHYLQGSNFVYFFEEKSEVWAPWHPRKNLQLWIDG